MTAAKLYIRDLIVLGTHGVSENERSKPQRFRVNLEVAFDIHNLNSDDIADTLNWSTLRRQIVNLISENSFNLMETLAQKIIDSITRDERVLGLHLELDKLDAFVSGYPGVALTYTRSE